MGMTLRRLSPIFLVGIGAGVFLYGTLGIFLAGKAQNAASLYLASPGGTFAVGDTFTVSLYVNTGGASINAIQADLFFPPDKLQVVSPSSGRSFIETWVTQPTYSNTKGTLHFAGAVPNPGISTNAGLISTITFRVVNTGTANIQFLDTSKVLLNDGQGTDVLNSVTGSIYTLTLPPPAGPIVTSPTDPDQSKWYTGTEVVLRWMPSLNAPADGFSFVLNDIPVDAPPNIVNSTNTFAIFNNLADGVHYFHVKTLRRGLWGGISNFAVRTDSVPPAAFQIDVSPSKWTSNQNPIFTFGTTDAASGMDHYEIKIVPLDLPQAQAAQANTPFFTEASSPYTQSLPIGTYDVIVRAYDLAGNFRQETQRISIVSPLFQMVDGNGLHVNVYTLPWWLVALLSAAILLVLAYLLARMWKLHRALEHRAERGVAEHPEIAQKLAELRQKQKEYENLLKTLSVILLCLGIWGSVMLHTARAQTLTLNPPIVNLFPSSISNNEILYVGGWANVANADVVIYIEQTETGNTFSGTVTTGADGNWLYSFPQFLDTGHYVAWAVLKQGAQASPPSGKVDFTVAPTVLQLGNTRIDKQSLYLGLFILFLVVALCLLALLFIYSHRVRVKRKKLAEAIHEAEESVRRGFSILRRDIELALATIGKAKLRGALSEEEKSREAKLLHDLDDINRYIGKEIWKVEEEEEKL